MLDNLDPNEPRTPKTRETPIEQRPVADREVPLIGRAGSATLHAWLDGEMPESAARHGDAARDVDFWMRLDRELLVRRQMTTPTHVYDQIMAALPSTAPEREVAWFRKPVTVTPVVAIGAAAGTLALGMVLGAALLKGR
jgi:hypothetical protein